MVRSQIQTSVFIAQWMLVKSPNTDAAALAKLCFHHSAHTGGSRWVYYSRIIPALWVELHSHDALFLLWYPQFSSPKEALFFLWSTKARQFKLVCHLPTLLLIPSCEGLQGAGSGKLSRTEIILGENEGESKRTKRMVFLSTKSLPCTTQCRGHFTAWEWYSCQGGPWLLLEWKFPMLQTLLHWEWVQCPGSTHARADALRPSLLKIPWTEKILEAVRELTGSAPCPRNSTALASTCNHPAALRWKRVHTQHTNVTTHGSCKVLYQALNNLQGLQICISQYCNLKNRTKKATLLPSHSQLFLWPYSGTNVICVLKQIGKLIKLRTSLGFWHTWMLLFVRVPPCLCNQWAAETQRSPADGRQASWVSFRNIQFLAFIQAGERLSCEQGALVSPTAPLKLWNECVWNPTEHKICKGNWWWSVEQEVLEWEMRNFPETWSLLAALIDIIFIFFPSTTEKAVP